MEFPKHNASVDKKDGVAHRPLARGDARLPEAPSAAVARAESRKAHRPVLAGCAALVTRLRRVWIQRRAASLFALVGAGAVALAVASATVRTAGARRRVEGARVVRRTPSGVSSAAGPPAAAAAPVAVLDSNRGSRISGSSYRDSRATPGARAVATGNSVGHSTFQSGSKNDKAAADLGHCLHGKWGSHDHEAVAQSLEFECPSFWPIAKASRIPRCCGKRKSGLLALSCQNPKQEERLLRGASLLKGKNIVFFGDSVGNHWLNVMLLEAHGKDNSLFPSNRSMWEQFYFKSFGPGNASYYQYEEELGGCRFPVRTINMTSAWPNAPAIDLFSYPNDWCPPKYKKTRYRQCCPGGRPRSVTGPISLQLDATRPDIVLAQMGVHWHTVPTFRAENAAMVSALGNYSAANPTALVLFLESLPQHFDSPAGDGSYDGFISAKNRSNFHCPPLDASQIESDLLLGDNSTSVGMHNINRIAKLHVEHTPGVQWLTSNSHAFARRNDGHDGASDCCSRHADCTHFCYSPHLWRPAVEPFLLAVENWYNRDRANFV